MVDEILKDFHLRKETYPFGSGRFNIEYIRQICQEDFANFLNEQFLEHDIVENIQVVKNRKYNHQLDIYESSVCDDVEFTHHDVLKESFRSSMSRKVDRFKQALNDPRDYVFIYYYRYSEKRDVLAVINQLQKWLDEVTSRSGFQPRLIFIHQEIISHFHEESCKFIDHPWGIQVTFNTTEVWTGRELWAAANDRHLFKEMLNHPLILQYVYREGWKDEQKRRRSDERKRKWQDSKRFVKNKLNALLKLNKR